MQNTLAVAVPTSGETRLLVMRRDIAALFAYEASKRTRRDDAEYEENEALAYFEATGRLRAPR